jgi:hypothetical protein
MPGAFGLMPYYYPAAEPEVRPDETLWQRHRSRVQAFFAEADVPAAFAGVVGQPADEIVDVAERHKAKPERHKAKLIVVHPTPLGRAGGRPS